MKMLKCIVFAFIALLLVSVRANPVLSNFRTVSSQPIEVIELEEPCVRQGGLCLRHEDCDPSNLVHVTINLCPKQKHLGVTCCYM